MQIDFENKTVIVTGAVRGIGRAIATAFAERGADVLAGDILADEVEQAANRPPPERGSLRWSQLDVANAESVARFVAEAEARSPNRAIDVLVHAAGGVRGQTRQPIEKVSEADWDAIVDANLRGAFLGSRAVAPGMKRAGSGRIVIISSRAGLGVSLTGIASYGTAKTAQIGLVRQLAAELGPHGITVNSVAPGFMRTSPDYERQWQSYGESEREAVFSRIAMRRWGTPEDIANAVLFFASEHASWVTGQTLAVTGGP